MTRTTTTNTETKTRIRQSPLPVIGAVVAIILVVLSLIGGLLGRG